MFYNGYAVGRKVLFALQIIEAAAGSWFRSIIDNLMIFYDAFMFAPFSNMDFFYVSAWLVVHCFCCKTSVTFAVAVIAGLRFIYAVLCVILCECASNEDTVELKSYKQFIVDIGLKMVLIALKLITCSS